MKPIDVLIVGAGPAGLAAAIRLRQHAGEDLSVVVVDKTPGPGYHSLSGAAFEPACLDELLPGWKAERNLLTDHVTPIVRDEMYFLFGPGMLPIPSKVPLPAAIRVPPRVVPERMHHLGDVTISVARLDRYLAEKAERLGVELYMGYAASRLIVEDGVVKGVVLGEVGLDHDGTQKPNHRPAEEIRARITILADGTHGVLSTQFGEAFGTGRNPQVYSLGIKAIVQFPGDDPFGEGRAIHTLGYPNPFNLFGGGFMYSMGAKTVAVGLILGLDWRYGDLNPQREFERYRAHPFVEQLLHGGVTVATGAKTIPEGGIMSMGPVSAPGALVVGDAAGLVNMEKIKGVHYAIGSGMAAADTVVDALPSGDFGAAALAGYRDRLVQRGIIGDLEHARNYRQSFRWGLVTGLPLSLIQSHLPVRLGAEPDHEGTRARKRLGRPDPGGMDQATFVSLTGTRHREDEPSHVTILDPTVCVGCAERYDSACTHFCPGQVYRWRDGAVALSPSNCLHCMTCAVKCPLENIRWVPPEGGDGPRFRDM